MERSSAVIDRPPPLEGLNTDFVRAIGNGAVIEIRLGSQNEHADQKERRPDRPRQFERRVMSHVALGLGSLRLVILVGKVKQSGGDGDEKQDAHQ